MEDNWKDMKLEEVRRSTWREREREDSRTSFKV